MKGQACSPVDEKAVSQHAVLLALTGEDILTTQEGIISLLLFE